MRSIGFDDLRSHNCEGALHVPPSADRQAGRDDVSQDDVAYPVKLVDQMIVEHLSTPPGR